MVELGPAPCLLTSEKLFLKDIGSSPCLWPTEKSFWNEHDACNVPPCVETAPQSDDFRDFGALKTLATEVRAGFERQHLMLEKLLQQQGHSDLLLSRGYLGGQPEGQFPSRQRSRFSTSPMGISICHAEKLAQRNNLEQERIDHVAKVDEKVACASRSNGDIDTPTPMDNRVESQTSYELHYRTAESKSGSKREITVKDAEEVYVLGRARGVLRRFLERSDVALLILIIISTNAMFIGIELAVSANLPLNQVPSTFSVINYIYVILFTLELMLKLGAFGFSSFFCGPNKLWNGLDFVIVLSAAVETSIGHAYGMDSFGSFRTLHVLKMARLVRGVRLLKIVQFVAALRNLMFSIASTLKPVFWSWVLMFIVLYGLAVVLTQASSDYCREQAIEAENDQNAIPSCSSPDFAEFWKDLPTSTFTLLKSIMGGISWHECVAPLAEMGWFWVCLFVFYVVFMQVTILNVVTGIFCQTAVESAAADKEIATLMQIAHREKYTASIKKLFKEMDEDGSSEITLDEFKNTLADESMKAFL